MSRFGSSFESSLNPIQPLQIHMAPPFVDENSPTFDLQIHCEETGLFRTMNHTNVTFSYARCFHGASLSIKAPLQKLNLLTRYFH